MLEPKKILLFFKERYISIKLWLKKSTDKKITHCEKERFDFITYMKCKVGLAEIALIFFDEKYYLDRYNDLSKLSCSPYSHYLSFGFFEGRSPSLFIDMDFIISNIIPNFSSIPIKEQQLCKTTLLNRYDGLIDFLIKTNSSPNLLFNNKFYIMRNKLEHLSIELPILHYFKTRGKISADKYLQTNSFIDLQDYMDLNRDLGKAKVIPLHHLIVYGLDETSRPLGRGAIYNSDFVENTSMLEGKKKISSLRGFISSGLASKYLAGPCWSIQQLSKPNPALNNKAIANKKAFIGIVLFKNTNIELTKLMQSIENEIKKNTSYDISYKFWVNDGDYDRYEKVLGRNDLLVSEAGNIGFGAAHNKLMEICFKEEQLYIGANPDGYFVPNSISRLIDFSSYYSNNAFIEASSMPMEHPKWFNPISLDTYWVSGACFALPRKLYYLTAGFDPKMHMYCEDVDLSWRVKALGGELKVCPNAYFYHDVTGRPFNIDEADPQLIKERRKNSLFGAYYLAIKWGKMELACHMKNILITEKHFSQKDKAFDVEISQVPSNISELIATHCEPDLRFAPSRYFK